MTTFSLETFDVSKILPREKYTIVNEEANKAMLALLTPAEKQTLDKFTSLLEGEFPEDVKDICTLVRFLRARKWDIAKAEKMYRARMQWIKEFQPHKITEQEVMGDIKTGKAFVYGKDKKGRPIFVYKAARHFPDWKDINVAFKFYILIAEILTHLVPLPPNDKLICIYDRRGQGQSNVDMKLFSRCICLADYYPETIGTIHIMGSNWFFSTLWRVASALLDPVTVAKVSMLPADEKAAFKELQNHIDPSNLIPSHGGNAKRGVFFPPSVPVELVFGTPAGVVEDKEPSKEEVEKIYNKEVKELNEAQRAQAEPTQDPSVNLQELDLD